MKRRAVIALSLALCVGGASRAEAEPRTPLCSALDALAARVQATGQAEYVTFFKTAPMEVACSRGRADDELKGQFCETAMKAAGLEFSHRYPWRVKACLAKGRPVAISENPSAYTGLSGYRRIEHLAGSLPGGVRLDLRYEPDTAHDNRDDPKDQFNGYYGRYFLTLWKQ